MPILDQNSLEFVSRSPEQTRRVGMRLGSLFQSGDILCLSGDLGSGKTTLVQGLAQGWGSLDMVSSPTFVLVNVYRRSDGKNLNHLDAYRLKGALEAEDLDLNQMLDSGALVIEWAERLEAILPAEHITIQMTWLSDEQRGMVFSCHGARYEQMLASFRQRTFGG